MPNSFYKFVESKDLKFLLSGSFKLGSLAYYRVQEALSGSRFIGDIMDGRNVETGIHLDSDNPEQKAEIIRRTKSVIGEKGRIVINGGTIVTNDDGFVLSLSYGDLQDLSRLFEKGVGEYAGYTAAIEILDMDRFVYLLAHARITSPDYLADQLVKDAFKDCSGGHINYADLTDKSQKPMGYADPFLKDSYFEEQQEFRIWFRNTPDAYEDAVYVQLPGGFEGVIKVVLNDPPGDNTKVTEQATPSLEELWHEFELMKWSIRDYFLWTGESLPLPIILSSEMSAEVGEDELQRRNLLHYIPSLKTAYMKQRPNGLRSQRVDRAFIRGDPRFIEFALEELMWPK